MADLTRNRSPGGFPARRPLVGGRGGFGKGRPPFGGRTGGKTGGKGAGGKGKGKKGKARTRPEGARVANESEGEGQTEDEYDEYDPDDGYEEEEDYQEDGQEEEYPYDEEGEEVDEQAPEQELAMRVREVSIRAAQASDYLYFDPDSQFPVPEHESARGVRERCSMVQNAPAPRVVYSATAERILREIRTPVLGVPCAAGRFAEWIALISMSTCGGLVSS